MGGKDPHTTRANEEKVLRDGQPFVGNLEVTISKGFGDVVDRLGKLIELVQGLPVGSAMEISKSIGASMDNPSQEPQQVCLSRLITIGTKPS